MLTGGTSKMEGVVELAEEIFHAPVRIGVPQDVKGLSDIVRNPIYSTGVGLLLYGLKQQQDRDVQTPTREVQMSFSEKVSAWIKKNL